MVINYATRGKQAKAQPAYIRIEAGDDSFTDRAYVQIGSGNTLRKMTLNDNTTKLSVQYDGKDWAATTIDATVGEMPLNFKATKGGTYTITVALEGVEMNYLHLIDNMTGTDVDLLPSHEYSFTAKTTDYESRFKLVFSTDDEDGPSTGSGAFAFFSNGNFVINGEGTLQVVDVMGRIIRTVGLSQCGSRTTTAGMPAGVYVLRLINGDNVRTQKIVIE